MTTNTLFRKLFIDKVISTLLIFILTLGGVFAFNSMVRENHPDLAIPSALITIEWPGAAAQQIEKEVTKPLEDILGGMNGLKKLNSGSQFSFSIVSVEFSTSLTTPEAMNQLRAKIDEASAKFPAEVKRPKVEQVSVNDTPVIEYMLFGEIDAYSLNEAAKTIAKKLENHPLIRKVDKAGFRNTSVHVRLLPERLRSLGITPLMVQNRLKQANQDMSWGVFDNGLSITELYYSGRFDSIEMLRALPITRTSDNRVVALEEVALVYKGLDKTKTETFFSENGSEYQKGISIGIKKAAGADTIALVSDVKALMANMKSQSFWPYGLEYSATSDESELINDSFDDIFSNVWQAMIAVFLVLMVLLTWREAVIAGLAIPLTFLGVLLALWVMGSTLNTMVIIGMVLALGLLVDVFILVMEGMHENIYVKKLSFSEAAIATVKTYAMPAFTGQLTTILAMSPMLAIGGIDGKFIRLIPLTGVLCLIISYIVAFVIAIPLSQLLLKTKKHSQTSKMDQVAKGISTRLKYWLQNSLLMSKARIWALITAVLVVWIGSAYLFSQLPSLLYPKEDGRNMAITIRLSPDATLEQSRAVAKIAGEFLNKQSFFDNVTMYVGKRSPIAVGTLNEQIAQNTSYNLVGFSVLFKPKGEREKMAFEYVDELRIGLERRLHKVPGISLTFKPATGGSSTDDPLQVVIKGDNLYKLKEYATQVKNELLKIHGVTDIRDNLGYFRSQISIRANAEALSFYGISEDELSAQLRIANEVNELGKFKTEGTQDDLDIQLSTYWNSRPDEIGGSKSYAELELLSIFNSRNESVPLGNLITYEMVNVPPVYIHKSSKRSVTIMAKLDDITVGEVIAQIEPELQEMNKSWGGDYRYYFSGEAESAGETYSSAGIALLFALLLVFAVLTLSLGTFTQALVVLSTIPLALIGTFSGFWLLEIPFSFPAMIGLISLIGIVVNNAIVMLDTMNGHLKAGSSVNESAALGASERLRPILGTTITTLVGLVPLALSSPMWFPLCMAIIFGLLASTVIAILVVPALYVLATRKQKLDMVNL
ncbi:efflux RND transporter permease subunit [Vibrio coralliilyticus]|uniref:efflux RND transporter permease subunit n=1 Tax=Vibrio coralliilyticus TaxID=190893 RepID=UPI00345E5C3C